MNEQTKTQRTRIVRFVVDTYNSASEDGTTKLKMTITVSPTYEQFEVEKEGFIRRGDEE